MTKLGAPGSLDEGLDAVRTVLWTGVEGDQADRDRLKFKLPELTQRQLGLVLAAMGALALLGIAMVGVGSFLGNILRLGVLLAVFAGAIYAAFLSRLQPLMAWRVCSVVVLVTPVGGWGALFPVTLMYMFVLGSVAYRHRDWIVGATALLSLLVLLVASGLERSVNPPSVLAAVVVPVVVGYLLGNMNRTRKELAVHQRASVVSNTERTRLEERARIAREMHDIVAHHMSMIVVRCETAPYRLADVPPACVEEFGGIGAAARSAMTDMQRLLGVLRGADQGPDLAPQPGLTELTDLVESARTAGVPVELTVDAEGEVSAAVGLTVYRVVQEALTNAGKHAPGAAVTVEVRRDGNVLTATVRNGPSDRRPTANSTGGHGLVGITERVKLHGGVVHSGPTEDGGFTVRATILVEGGE